MSPVIPRRAVLAGGLAAASRPAFAQRKPIRIGVLTALSGEYTDAVGYGSVVATNLAVADFKAAYKPDFDIEVVAGDLLDKPDIGLGIARRWFDQQGVDAIVDVANSAVALAIASTVRERNKVAVFTAPGVSTLSGPACSPNHLLWSWDTWAVANCVSRAVLAEGADTWFFIAADYAFGKIFVADATEVLTANGAKVLGEVRFPFPDTTDYASYLLRAQASGAKAIGVACAGNNFINLVKQAAEFGILGSKQRLVSMLCLITYIHAIGLQDAQGLQLVEPFYWDKDEATRAFSARFSPLYRGIRPALAHAGAYSGTLHYLKAVASLGPDVAQRDGRAVVAEMKRLPAEDPLFGKSVVRENGSVLHDMYLFEVKSPKEQRYPWDYYKLVSTIPAEQAYKTVAASGCDLTKR